MLAVRLVLNRTRLDVGSPEVAGEGGIGASVPELSLPGLRSAGAGSCRLRQPAGHLMPDISPCSGPVTGEIRDSECTSKAPSGERVMIGAMRILRPMAITACLAFTVDA
jgi:hypothetical protein